MTTCRSDMGRRAAALIVAGAALLAGCAATPGGGFLSGGTGSSTPLTRAALDRGRFSVAGPKGYCIDRAGLAPRPGGGVAILGSCRILSDGKGGAHVPPAILTVSVDAPGSAAQMPSAEDFAKLVHPARVLTQGTGDDVVRLHLAGGGDARFDDGDPRHWRGLARIDGRLAALAIYAPTGGAMAGAAGERLLMAFAASLRQVNPAAPRKAAAPDGRAGTAQPRPPSSN